MIYRVDVEIGQERGSVGSSVVRVSGRIGSLSFELSGQSEAVSAIRSLIQLGADASNRRHDGDAARDEAAWSTYFAAAIHSGEPVDEASTTAYRALSKHRDRWPLHKKRTEETPDE